MTGLEKILSQIEYESDDRCRAIIDDAKKKADIIIQNANVQASSIIDECSEQTAKKLENMKQSAVSSAELAKSKLLLKSKLEIIDDMLDKALGEIKALPDKEYFEIIKALIIKNAKSGDGILCFSKNDMQRLPKGFVDEVNKELSSGAIALGDGIDITAGFILVYGDIDINCSFDAIAQEKRDELRDALNALLFY